MPSEPALAWNNTGLISSPPQSGHWARNGSGYNKGWLNGGPGCIGVHHDWLTPSLGPQALIRHERCTYIITITKWNSIYVDPVSPACVCRRELVNCQGALQWAMAQSINISGLQHCGVCASMPPLPPCIPAATCIPTVPLPRPATAQYRVYMCTYLCLRVPAKLAQHLERISVPLFCSHCLEWAKGGQVQGSTGSRFIFPFISILTLPCNHPHSRLFSMPGPITREMVGGGKPGDGPQYKKKNR